MERENAKFSLFCFGEYLAFCCRRIKTSITRDTNSKKNSGGNLWKQNQDSRYIRNM